MVTKWIDDAPNTPSMLVGDLRDYRRSGRDGLRKHRVRVIDSQNHPHRTASQGFRAEVEVLWRFIGEPEFRSIHRQSGNYLTFVVLDAK